MTALSAAELEQLAKTAKEALTQATTTDQLEDWRIAYLGRKGALPTLLRKVKDLPTDQKRQLGQTGNQLRQELEQAYQEKRGALSNGTEKLPTQKKSLQPTTYNLQPKVGHHHPISQALRLTQQIFSDLGFLLVEGPSVEEAKYNFDALNVPFEHPARAETDTFYLENFPDYLLRTQVSSLQIRGVLENDLKPPFKMIYYGPSYRAEKEDATHGSFFQQYEFMVVSKTANLAELKSIITEFYSRFFGQPTTIRFRPAYFPFVEPGLEVDMQDTITGKGDWLEMAGAGAVHPNVLRNINIDPTEYQGIALGGGLDRLAMLKYGIPDLRLFYSGNLDFLRQF